MLQVDSFSLKPLIVDNIRAALESGVQIGRREDTSYRKPVAIVGNDYEYEYNHQNEDQNDSLTVGIAVFEEKEQVGDRTEHYRKQTHNQECSSADTDIIIQRDQV